MPRQYYKDVRFEHYRTFTKVARLGSFAAAGRSLGLSRPTVWQQIDTLEREFGVKLFERVGHGVAPSSAGQMLLELVQPSIAAFDSLGDVFRARLADAGGTLRLAIIQGRDLDQAIIRFRRDYPRIHLKLVEHRSINVVRLVESGSCDIGLAMVSPEMAAHPIVHFEPLGRRTFMLVAPQDHPLVRKRTLRLEDLVEYPLITFSQDNPFRQYVERVFDQAGLLSRMQAQVAIEIDSVEAADNCVFLGLGVALVLPPRRNVPPPTVVYRSLAGHFGRMPLHLVWEKGTHLLPHVEAFVRIAKKLSSARDLPAVP